MARPHVRVLQEDVYVVERSLGEGEPPVAAILIVGRERAALVDTLTCPADMDPVRDLLARLGRSPIVINTHADWDHCWGNGAFPKAPLIGHRLCRERLLSSEAEQELRQRRDAQPAWFTGATLVAPYITFDRVMEIDLCGLTVALHHVPGHTSDCLVAHVPERGLLLAGDCAEDPLPLVGDPGHVASWARQLRRWAESDVRVVVPSHGPPAGPAFLAANAAYLDGLLAGTPSAPGESAPAFYHQAHRDNARAVAGTRQV